MAEETSYRFAPLERRGLLLGLGAGQLVVVAVSLLVAFAIVTSWPGTGGFVGAAGSLGMGALACRPVRGRPPTEWAAIALGYWPRRRVTSSTPIAHAQPAGPGHQRVRLPAATFGAGVWLSELPETATDGAMGIVLDEKVGTIAALLRARGAAFCLLDGPGQATRLAGWATVLESLAGERSALARLQWCQRAVPGDSEALLAHLRRAGDPSSPAYPGYRALLERAGPRSWRHETLLVVVVQCRLSRGRPDREGADSLSNEVRALRAQMGNVGLVCEGVLDGPGVARALGGYLVPGLSHHPDAYPWPLSVQEHWGELRGDGYWHRTYWVAEWPRSRVGPDFLSPLLIGKGRRSFSVVMAPVPPQQAARDAESARTAQMADAHLRAQGGFLETARHRRQVEAVEGREAQLADGRGAFQLAGYVAVSAEDRPGLDQACADLERAAGAARLCLRPLYGQQRPALTWALPLGRGL